MILHYPLVLEGIVQLLVLVSLITLMFGLGGLNVLTEAGTTMVGLNILANLAPTLMVKAGETPKKRFEGTKKRPQLNLL